MSAIVQSQIFYAWLSLFGTSFRRVELRVGQRKVSDSGRRLWDGVRQDTRRLKR
jgi:hypothetical protein